LPEDIGVHALDLGIPIYPVATNYQHHIHHGYPRNLWRMKYVIGFVPDSNASPGRHNLEVRVVKKSSGSVEGGKRRAVY
jgi:hypothetical protein